MFKSQILKLFFGFFQMYFGFAMWFIFMIHFFTNQRIVFDRYNGNAIGIECLLVAIILEINAIKILIQIVQNNTKK